MANDVGELSLIKNYIEIQKNKTSEKKSNNDFEL